MSTYTQQAVEDVFGYCALHLGLGLGVEDVFGYCAYSKTN